MSEKQELRRRIRALKRCHAASLAEQSALIRNRLMRLPAIVSSRVLMAYHPLPDEVDISGLLGDWLEEGKTVLLPQVVDDGNMVLRRYEGPDSLIMGAFGILEPQGELFGQYDEIDTVLVPGMAFDAAGHRLGRGKGYYDRLLPKLTNAFKIGICFDFQMVDSVPSESHDMVVDEVFQ